METQIIRNIVRIGNSSGVVLPKSWLNQKAKVELIIQKSSDMLSGVMKILENEIELKKIIGIYLIGSYARGEEKIDSDIDILAITEDADRKIKKGRYEILLVSRKKLDDSLKDNMLPLLPMLKESKSLLNENLILDYKELKLNKKSLKWHIKTTREALKKSKYLIESSKKLKEKNVYDSVAYSLVLRLRGIYIIDCLRKSRLWTNKELIGIIKKISGSITAYERYNYIKNENLKNKQKLQIEEAEKLFKYIREKNIEQEKWLKDLKD